MTNQLACGEGPLSETESAGTPMDNQELNSYRLILSNQNSPECVVLVKKVPSLTSVDRRPIDPPPIIQLEITSQNDEQLFNPYYFMYASLISTTSTEELHLLRDSKTRSTTGSIVSSLYRLKDIDEKEGAFFVFPDLSVRMEGTYRLKFSLFEIIKAEIFYCTSICSDIFYVYPAKKFPGMEESTFLSKVFADQGLKIRIRKEMRVKGSGSRNKRSASDMEESPDFKSDSDNGTDDDESIQESAPRHSTAPGSGNWSGPSGDHVQRRPIHQSRSYDYGGISQNVDQYGRPLPRPFMGSIGHEQLQGHPNINRGPPHSQNPGYAPRPHYNSGPTIMSSGQPSSHMSMQQHINAGGSSGMQGMFNPYDQNQRAPPFQSHLPMPMGAYPTQQRSLSHQLPIRPNSNSFQSMPLPRPIDTRGFSYSAPQSQIQSARAVDSNYYGYNSYETRPPFNNYYGGTPGYYPGSVNRQGDPVREEGYFRPLNILVEKEELISPVEEKEDGITLPSISSITGSVAGNNLNSGGMTRHSSW